jgi:penicillin amidase
MAVCVAACRRAEPDKPAPPTPPQTAGIVHLPGLVEPVTVVRDAWGIPHITAANTDDLFRAQGFVQAQDRLFQMDLWRRSVQGRLSEVLGANFVDRDAMTRRMQFRGDIDREWASYGPDARRIALAFTEGINAWVSSARRDPPEEFILAGWPPEFWKPEDLLNRTDAFLASADAADDLFRARLGAAIGLPRVDALLPPPGRRRTIADPDVDLSAITFVVPDTLRRVGSTPFFLTLAAPVTEAPRPGRSSAVVSPLADTRTDRPPANAAAWSGLSLPGTGGYAWVVEGPKSATGGPLVAVAPRARFDNPSLRYLVHLRAPGWNVAGATSPWLPGVVIGHNGSIAWGMTPAPFDTQDIFVERFNPADPHQVERAGRWADMAVDRERVDVKGRSRPFEFERMYSSNGVVIAIDHARHLLYTLRWSGAEPGGAGELASIAIDRATSLVEFREALSRWKMPSATFVYGDVAGQVASQAAGLVPLRTEHAGRVPLAGWTGKDPWVGWQDMTRPIADNALPARGGDSAVVRISAVLSGPGLRTLDDLRRLQFDVLAVNAQKLIPLLRGLRSVPPQIEPMRTQLSAWDMEVRPVSAEATLYIAWESALRQILAAGRVPSEFANELASRLDLVAILTRPASTWFEGNPGASRNKLLADALMLVSNTGDRPNKRLADREVTFTHPLAVFDESKRRFNVGPFPLGGYAGTVFATDRSSGPVFQAIFDVSDWNRSVVTNAPGEAGSPASPHFDDMAAKWAAGDYVPLLFDQEAVAAAATETLTLQPR